MEDPTDLKRTQGNWPVFDWKVMGKGLWRLKVLWFFIGVVLFLLWTMALFIIQFNLRKMHLFYCIVLAEKVFVCFKVICLIQLELVKRNTQKIHFWHNFMVKSLFLMQADIWLFVDVCLVPLKLFLVVPCLEPVCIFYFM